MMQDKNFLKLATCVFLFSLFLNTTPLFAQTVVLNGKTVVENGQPVVEQSSDSSVEESKDSSSVDEESKDSSSVDEESNVSASVETCVPDTVRVVEKLSVDSTLKAYGITRSDSPWAYAFWTNFILALSQTFFKILSVQFMFCAIAFMANRIAKKTNNTDVQMIIVVIFLGLSVVNILIQS